MTNLGPDPPEESHLLRKALKLVKLFEGFSEEDAQDFLRCAKRRDARPGERVIAEGKLGNDMYIVAAGELSVLKSCGAQDEELATLGPGDSFGEVALVDCGPRSASIVALTQSILLRFERRSLVKVPGVSLKLYRNLATMMAARLRDTSTRVILAKGIPDPAQASAPQPVPPGICSAQARPAEALRRA